MAWAKVDGDGRVLEASEDRLDGFDEEFSNVDEYLQTGPASDWVVSAGSARYEPTAPSRAARARARLAETDYVAAKSMDALASCTDLDGLLSVLASVRAEYADVLAERAALRAVVNDAEGR